MYGLPRYFPHLVELFQNTAIDGSTSTIPGVSNFDAPWDVEDEEVDNEGNELGSQVSAPSTNSSRCKVLDG
jgi:hypothetical protein